MEYTAKGTINFKDYNDYLNFAFFTAFFQNKRLRSIVITCAALIMGLIAYELFAILSGSKAFYASPLYYTLLLAVSIGFSILFMIPSQRKRTFASSKLLQDDFSLLLNENHMVITQSGGSVTITKSTLNKILLNKSGFYVYLAQNQAVIIPYRWFSKGTPAELTAFLTQHFLEGTPT